MPSLLSPYTLPILMLVASNVFMTLAWYGHLKFKGVALPLVIVASWGIAFLEYCLAVPANRIGFKGNGGPYSLVELKVRQEVITLVIFSLFTLLVFKTESFRLNHLIGFACLVAAVYFIFKK